MNKLENAVLLPDESKNIFVVVIKKMGSRPPHYVVLSIGFRISLLRLFEQPHELSWGVPQPPGTMDSPCIICQVIVKLVEQFAGCRGRTGGVHGSQAPATRARGPSGGVQGKIINKLSLN